MSLKIGGSSNKSSMQQTSTQTLDPALAAARQSYMSGVQDFAANNPYQTTNASQIQNFMNPYTQNVADVTVAEQERARQLAQQNTDASAVAANAFGGSRHGVANALTNEANDRTTASLLANLNQANYSQALGAAQTENQNAMTWKLALQQLLGAATQGLGDYGTTNTTGSGKGSGFNWGAGVSWSPSKGIGGA